jgi:hypothetical protein
METNPQSAMVSYGTYGVQPAAPGYNSTPYYSQPTVPSQHQSIQSSDICNSVVECIKKTATSSNTWIFVIIGLVILCLCCLSSSAAAGGTAWWLY